MQGTRTISRRGLLLGAAATATAVAVGAGTRLRQNRPLNVLYISADDLGTTLGAYGFDQVISPNIDAFARRSVLFERCHCQIAICTGSRTSILSGIRPETSGLIDIAHDWQAALPQARSLPRHFRDHGYRTASVGKIFDRRGGGPDDCWDEQVSERGVRDSVSAIEALNDLARGDQPYFLAVGYAQPHCPWEPSAESMALYDVDRVEPFGPGRTFESTGLQDCAGATALEVTEAEARAITARYLADVTDLDRAVGDLLASADELGVLDDTIVIFWSGDHGLHLGRSDRWGKWTCHDAATRVPLMMSVPGVTKAGTRVPGIVECVDMYPTLVELCGLGQPPQGLEGMSFAPLLDDPGRPWKHSAFSVFGVETIGQRSITTERYNYIEWEARRFRPASRELYDLVADPQETQNLVEVRPEIAGVLAKRLELGPAAARPNTPPIAW